MLNKKSLMKTVVDVTGGSSVEAERAVESVINQIREALLRGE